MKKKAVVLLLSLIAAVGLSACGSGKASRVVGGVIHIGRGLVWTARTKSVGGVRIGSRAVAVRSRFGVPLSSNDREGRLTCWWYRAEQPNSSLDGVGFCINPQQRVERILPAVHL